MIFLNCDWLIWLQNMLFFSKSFLFSPFLVGYLKNMKDWKQECFVKIISTLERAHCTSSQAFFLALTMKLSNLEPTKHEVTLINWNREQWDLIFWHLSQPTTGIVTFLVKGLWEDALLRTPRAIRVLVPIWMSIEGVVFVAENLCWWWRSLVE